MTRFWTPHRLVGVIAYAVLGVCIVILFNVNARQDAFDARRASDIATANAETVKCVFKALRADASQTKELRDVARDRDDDLASAIRALIVMVDVRVLGGVNQNEQTAQAGAQFITQANDFLEQSKKLNEARDANPVPKKICGVVIE